jgi:translation initiation factor IF-2
MFQLFVLHDNKLCKMYKWNEIQDCHGQSIIQQEDESSHQQTELKLKEETGEFYTCSIDLCGAETWTLRKVYQKYLESFEM